MIPLEYAKTMFFPLAIKNLFQTLIIGSYKHLETD